MENVYERWATSIPVRVSMRICSDPSVIAIWVVEAVAEACEALGVTELRAWGYDLESACDHFQRQANEAACSSGIMGGSAMGDKLATLFREHIARPAQNVSSVMFDRDPNTSALNTLPSAKYEKGQRGHE